MLNVVVMLSALALFSSSEENRRWVVIGATSEAPVLMDAASYGSGLGWMMTVSDIGSGTSENSSRNLVRAEYLTRAGCESRSLSREVTAAYQLPDGGYIGSSEEPIDFARVSEGTLLHSELMWLCGEEANADMLQLSAEAAVQLGLVWQHSLGGENEWIAFSQADGVVAFANVESFGNQVGWFLVFRDIGASTYSVDDWPELKDEAVPMIGSLQLLAADCESRTLASLRRSDFAELGGRTIDSMSSGSLASNLPAGSTGARRIAVLCDREVSENAFRFSSERASQASRRALGGDPLPTR